MSALVFGQDTGPVFTERFLAWHCTALCLSTDLSIEVCKATPRPLSCSSGWEEAGLCVCLRVNYQHAVIRGSGSKVLPSPTVEFKQG